MDRALEKPDANPPYLEFFGLEQPPFARLSGSPQIYHVEQNSLLMAHLAKATEQSDCLTVICGPDGSGKTTLLNSYISGLDDEVNFSIIDATCASQTDFYIALLKHIGFSDITGTSNELRHITKQFLVNRGTAGDPVLVIIDNAHRVSPMILEQLRWLAAIKISGRRAISVILAGNTHLVSVMNSPAMSHVKFNHQVHFNLRNYTEDETTNYVSHRLQLAGGSDSVKIPDETYPLIYRYTGGVPRQINRLCDAVLAEACALETRVIRASLVRSVVDKHGLLRHVIPLHGRGRRKTDRDFKPEQPEAQAGAVAKSADAAVIAVVEKNLQKTADSDIDGKKRLAQISKLREHIGDLTADKMRALADIDTRDGDITELRSRLHVQTAETARLTKALHNNANEIKSQGEALSYNIKALRNSEDAADKLSDALEQEKIATKTAQADIAKAEAKASQLNEMHVKLDAQTVKSKKLANALERNTEEIQRQNEALSDSTMALRESEKVAEKLSADLENERTAARNAQNEIAITKEKADELGQLKIELQAAFGDITADLNEAEERVSSVDNLEASAVTTKDEIAADANEEISLRGELNFRDSRNYDVEKQNSESQNEAAFLENRFTAIESLAEPVSTDAAIKGGHDSTEAAARFIQATENIPAYQTLSKYDPATYNGLITTYEHMERQGYSEQRIEVALRVMQAELIERRLPKASDKALINYARLIADQLRRFKLHGDDLCFRMLVPQNSNGDDVSPHTCELTREREFALLELVLRTYDAGSDIPTEEDIWPDLEPIFIKLFDDFGEADVSAHFDVGTPVSDQEKTCAISVSLYYEILKLRKKNAANVLRWILDATGLDRASHASQ